jgi:hypothetical protein
VLIGFWVRSYSNAELIYHSSGGQTVFGTAKGRFTFSQASQQNPSNPQGWVRLANKAAGFLYRYRFRFTLAGPLLTIEVPGWFPVSISMLLAALPWMRLTWLRQLSFRFSLRTLLIATTLVAVVLGLIVWLR